MLILTKAKTRLEELHIVPSGDLVPCTVEEIQLLECKLGHSLPEAYKEFLLWMGHSTGRLLAGSDYSYRDLASLQIAAEEMLREDKFTQSLPDDAFVFLMHQGYQFSFIRTLEGDDPPVYDYVELMEATTFPLVFCHFSEFLFTVIEDYAKLREDIAQRIADTATRSPDTAKRMAENARQLGDYGNL